MVVHGGSGPCPVENERIKNSALMGTKINGGRGRCGPGSCIV